MLKKCIYVLLLVILILGEHAYAEQWIKVRWVDDGDTIVLDDNRRIRYIGINAPEIAHGNRKAEPFGDEASEFNKRLVFQKNIRLEFDKESTDQYGRTLAYVFLEDGSFVNAKIVEAGLAHVLPCKPECKYDSQLLSFQRTAMSAGKGMWHNWKEDRGPFIGNQNSKRFHLETCGLGQKTGKKNKVMFYKKWDAFWAGFAPCKVCMSGK